jgi:hypothetical protein
MGAPDFLREGVAVDGGRGRFAVCVMGQARKCKQRGSHDRDPGATIPWFPGPRHVDVDDAFEESTFRKTDALCNHIADQGTFTANVHTFADVDVAVHFSQSHHFAGTDIRRHSPIAANRDTAARQVDCALDLTVNVQRTGTC